MGKKNRNRSRPTGSAGVNKPLHQKKTSDSGKSMVNRRNALRLLIAVPVVGVAGAAIHKYDAQNKGLHDLSLIGQGIPVVVQVHDPSCPLCRRLMKNTRKALANRSDVLFRVADVTSLEGSSFQQKHNVPTVTLVVFNSKGRKVDTIVGVKPADELESRFSSL